MTSEWHQDDIRMISEWLQDDFRMTSGWWLLDDFRFTSDQRMSSQDDFSEGHVMRNKILWRAKRIIDFLIGCTLVDVNNVLHACMHAYMTSWPPLRAKIWFSRFLLPLSRFWPISFEPPLENPIFFGGYKFGFHSPPTTTILHQKLFFASEGTYTSQMNLGWVSMTQVWSEEVKTSRCI